MLAEKYNTTLFQSLHPRFYFYGYKNSQSTKTLSKIAAIRYSQHDCHFKLVLFPFQIPKKKCRGVAWVESTEVCFVIRKWNNNQPDKQNPKEMTKMTTFLYLCCDKITQQTKSKRNDHFLIKLLRSISVWKMSSGKLAKKVNISNSSKQKYKCIINVQSAIRHRLAHQQFHHRSHT